MKINNISKDEIIETGSYNYISPETLRNKNPVSYCFLI
jgi:hypothetical protein